MPDIIDPRELVPMDVFPAEPFAIEVVYANEDHPENIFGTAVYHKEARLILHRDLAHIVIGTTRKLHKDYGWTLILKDGLRPIEAQAALMERVRGQLGDGATLLLSGGAAAAISPRLRCVHRVVDNLVLHGLQRVALSEDAVAVVK